MVKHIVMWNIDKDDIEKVKNKFESMLDKIPQVLKIETGVGIDSQYANRNFVLITYHQDINDLYNYQAHPYHIEVSKFVSNFLRDRVCIDSETKN